MIFKTSLPFPFLHVCLPAMFAERFGPSVSTFLEQDKQAFDFLSQEIWKNPELCFEEFFAHGLLTEFLERRGFEVQRGAHGLATAFRAEFKTDGYQSGLSPVVAILCEYDALPEIGHACGHNLIAECGIASACAVQDVLKRELQIPAKLVVIGCPAEEGGGGKIDLINAGAFDEVNFSLMVHPSSHNVLHSVTLATEKCKIEFRIRNDRDSETHDRPSALDASMLTYTNVSLARQRMKPDWRIHGVISDGGVHPDVFPERSESFYFVRCRHFRDLPLTKDTLTRCAKSAAIATDCEVIFDWDMKPYLPMQSNSAMEYIFGHYAEDEGITYGPDPGLNGSSDMGNVTFVVPSIHPKFFVGEPHLIHSREFQKLAGTQLAQPYCLKIAKTMAMTTLELFLNERSREAAVKEFSLLSSL